MQRSGRRWARLQPLLGVLLLLFGIAASPSAAQDAVPVAVDCSVTITQPTQASFRTRIACSSQDDTSGFFVVVQNATWLNHDVNYTLNGVEQTLDNTTFVEDGSLLNKNAYTNSPALVSLGFLRSVDADYASTGFIQNLTTLSITASVVGIVLPADVSVQPALGINKTFSCLRLTGVANLLIRDSVFDNISSSNQQTTSDYAAVTFNDYMLDASATPAITPAINVTNTTFSNFVGGSGDSGGALLLQPLSLSTYGPVFISNTNFTGNTANTSGAALYAKTYCASSGPCPSQLSISNCHFTSNSCTSKAGGAVWAYASTMQISHSTFSNNSAASSGGALYFQSFDTSSVLTVSDTTFSANTAGTYCKETDGCNVQNDGGGAMAVVTSQYSDQTSAWSGSTVLTVQDSNFVNNQNAKVFAGGAVLFSRLQTGGQLPSSLPSPPNPDALSTALFKNVTFSNSYIPNGTTTGSGGAIFDLASDGLTIDNCTFGNNTAGRGSSVYSLWSTYVNITGGTTVQGSVSESGGGGAVVVSDLVQGLVVRNATFTNNVCRRPDGTQGAPGAAIYMERNLLAQDQLPGIPNYTASISDTSFTNNSCQQAGAMYINQVEHAIGPNVIFDGNTATVLGSAGGAVYLTGLTDPRYLVAAPSSNISGVVFRNNVADSNGGALYTSGIWQPRIINSAFINNTVTTKTTASGLAYSGGALYVGRLRQAPFVIDATNFTDNKAYQGGALTVAQSDVHMTSCWFDGNVATGSGGAMRWNTAGSGNQVNITGSNFTHNVAKTAGALQVSQAGTFISGCRFTDNNASLAGGAISFESCKPAANTTLGLYTPAARVDPEAVADPQTAYVLDSVFERNLAVSKGGGAVYATSSRVALIRNNSTNNNSTWSGGVVYGENSLINDYLGSFASNQAQQGGAFYTESCNVTFNTTLLQGNNATRGGAVSAGLARADSRQPGLVTLELNNCTASGNAARNSSALGAGYGGCVSAQGSNVTVRQGAWYSNTAAVAGGAIDARGNSTLVLQGIGTMRLNSAMGGTGGAVNIDGMASALIINTDMQNNTALSDGGSLWSGGTYCLMLINSDFSYSNTTTGSGGGAYASLPGTQGCTTALVSPYRSRLSQAGVAALPQALRPPGQASGRRLLQQSTALDSIALNLLVVGTAFTSSRAANGGGLALQLSPGGAAVLDQATITGCSDIPAGVCPTTGSSSGTTSSDGGGLYMTMIKPTLSVQASSTCSVLNQTSTVDITSSILTSNAASSGNGGAAAVVSNDAALTLQATFSNSTITNNTAVNGGALSAVGPGAFLAVLSGTGVQSNTATPSSAEAPSGSSGGCIYAQNCQGLLLGNATQLSRCQALPGAGGRVAVSGVSTVVSGRSLGGAVSADTCQAIVADGATITGNTAGAGGGIAAKDVTALLLLNTTLSNNAANAGNTTPTTTTLEALSGVGGGMWVTGKTASLVRSSNLRANTASLFGGAAAALAECYSNGTGTSASAPTALADYPMLGSLAGRAASACYIMSVQSASVADNLALDPTNSASGSGGAFFGISNNSIVVNACTDIQTSGGSSVSRSADLGVVRSSLLQVAACPRNNNSAGGYGDIVATMPVAVSLSQNATAQQVDPLANTTGQGSVPLVWFTTDNALVLPSTSPVTPAVIALIVTDAAGQSVQDPYLSSIISVTVSSPNSDPEAVKLYGDKVATYNSAAKDYRITGLNLKAPVGNSYTLAFTLTTTLDNGGQMAPLQQVVLVPDCGNGEVYEDNKTVCRQCNGSLFGLSQTNLLGSPAPDCLPCPSEAQCSGGAVLVPVDGQWHSAPNSTQLHNCMNNEACARDDNQVANLQVCQSAWYAFEKLVQLSMSQEQVNQVAAAVLASYNCTLYTLDSLAALDPAPYLNLLCADGYGGNLCGVCVRNSAGKQTALKSNSRCSECSPDWVVYLISALLFVINLAVIMIQVFAALGEQMLSSTVQFADIFGAIINHVQYLIVILKLQFQWPKAVTDFHQAISSTVSFANDAIKFASITCLSDGSPEAQATYKMGSSLTLPLILVGTAVVIWIVCYYLRLYVWYPRQDRSDNGKRGSQTVTEELPTEQSLQPAQSVVNELPQGHPDMLGRSGPYGGRSHGQRQSLELTGSHRSAAPDPSGGFGSSRAPAQSAHSGYGADVYGTVYHGSVPATGWSDAFRSTTQRSAAGMPAAAADDDAPPANANQMMQEVAPSLRRNQTDLRRWQLPGAEKAPDEALWFNSEAEERERQQRKEEDKIKLTLVAKFRLLDKYMPLWQQLFAVIINTCFVVYQGWASAALSPFACQYLDDGTIDPGFPDNFAYYAGFQQATAAGGYWNLNMNQACYEGIHLTKWTPIGAVMSFIIGLGIPFAMFLPVFMSRRQLTSADVQLRWGWLYIRFYYARLPYWMAVQALELLVFIIVQTFTGGLNSVTEQAVLLQVTLIVILVFNTCMWPLVHPLLILTSFLSNAILIFTLGLAMIIGDGSAWTLTDGQANTAGAFIIITNVLLVVLLVFLFYKHLRDVIEDGFLKTTTTTRKVVGRVWQRGLVATRNLRSMKTYTGVRSILGRPKKKGINEQMSELSLQPSPAEALEQARENAVRAVDQESARHGSTH